MQLFKTEYIVTNENFDFIYQKLERICNRCEAVKLSLTTRKGDIGGSSFSIEKSKIKLIDIISKQGNRKLFIGFNFEPTIVVEIGDRITFYPFNKFSIRYNKNYILNFSPNVFKDMIICYTRSEYMRIKKSLHYQNYSIKEAI